MRNTCPLPRPSSNLRVCLEVPRNIPYQRGKIPFSHPAAALSRPYSDLDGRPGALAGTRPICWPQRARRRHERQPVLVDVALTRGVLSEVSGEVSRHRGGVASDFTPLDAVPDRYAEGREVRRAGDGDVRRWGGRRGWCARRGSPDVLRRGRHGDGCRSW